MKLIKTLDSRLESTTAKSGQTKRFGLFICPVCNSHVEKPLTHGRRNKTCGDAACRKAAFKSGNVVHTEKNMDSVSNWPFYSAIKSYYSTLTATTGYTVDESLDTLAKFIEHTYVDYASIREMHGNKRVIAIPTVKGSTTLSKDNIQFVLQENATVPYESYMGALAHCCSRLSADTGVSYSSIHTAVAKLGIPYTDTLITTDYGTKLNTKVFTAKDYTTLHNVLLVRSAGVRKASILYVLKCEKYTKIGITRDLDKRLGSIRSSNPFPVDVLTYSTQSVEETYLVEQYLHAKYSANNVTGEWFELSEDAQLELVTKVSNSTVIRDWEEHTKAVEEAKQHKIEELNKLRLAKSEALPVRTFKPEVEVVVNEGKEEYINDRSAQIASTTKHGKVGEPIYKEWRRLVSNWDIADEWKESERFMEDVADEFEAFEGSPRIVGNVLGKIGPNNYKIVDTSDIVIDSPVAIGVIQLDKEGNEVARYASAAEASREVEGSRTTNIAAVCKGKRKTHAGFVWKYSLD